jgi:dienelactone hydrolase
MAAALRAQGVHVETKIYPGRSHADTVAALSVPARARASVLQDVADFMQRLTNAPRTERANLRRQTGLEAAAP